MTEYEKKNLQAKEKLIHFEGGSLHFKPNEQRNTRQIPVNELIIKKKKLNLLFKRKMDYLQRNNFVFNLSSTTLNP